jgi:acyl carrier protein
MTGTNKPALPPEVAAKSDAVVPQLIKLLEDFTQDWDHEMEGSMNRETKLLGDLGFESIDIIQLVVAIEEDISKKKVPFDKLLMQHGRYVDDLSIGQISDFIAVFI